MYIPLGYNVYLDVLICRFSIVGGLELVRTYSKYARDIFKLHPSRYSTIVMETIAAMHEAHFVPLHAQSNSYCLSPLLLEGRNKLVVATIRGEISCLEFHSPSAQRPPSFTPVNFTYIPGEALDDIKYL